MFGERLTLMELADWCRALSTSLRSGIPILRALRSSADRGSPRIKRASAALLESLKSGEDVPGAVAEHSQYFPPLFVNMVNVGVHTGHLPEVLRELEAYYRSQITLRRQFLQQITWPGIQLGMAIGIIGLVIYLLGILPAGDVLGLGLKGETGVLIWFGAWAFLAAGGYALYELSRNKFGMAATIDQLLLTVPVLGKTLKLLALSRMCMAMNLTLESGMPLKQAIPLSMDASDNQAISRLSTPIVHAIRAGDGLHEAFSTHPVFPHEFLDALLTAEESGKVPEQMQHLSLEFQERSQHQMHLLNVAAGWVVWLIVAVIIIFFIIRIAMTAYIGPMYDVMDELNM